MQIDHLKTAIAEQVPRLQSWEVDGLAKKLESSGLIAPDRLVRVGHIVVDHEMIGRVVFDFHQGPIATGMPVFISLVAPMEVGNG